MPSKFLFFYKLKSPRINFYPNRNKKGSTKPVLGQDLEIRRPQATAVGDRQTGYQAIPRGTCGGAERSGAAVEPVIDVDDGVGRSRSGPATFLGSDPGWGFLVAPVPLLGRLKSFLVYFSLQNMSLGDAVVETPSVIVAPN